MKIKKRNPITLLEIMIAIFIIGIITSVISFNMKGSLEKGKAFKTEQGSKQVYEIITYAFSQDREILDQIHRGEPFDLEECLQNSGFVKYPKKLMRDGWGEVYEIIPKEDDDIFVVSKHYISFLKKKDKTFEDLEETCPWMASLSLFEED